MTTQSSYCANKFLHVCDAFRSLSPPPQEMIVDTRQPPVTPVRKKIFTRCCMKGAWFFLPARRMAAEVNRPFPAT
jgi:hypothetical protein